MWEADLSLYTKQYLFSLEVISQWAKQLCSGEFSFKGGNIHMINVPQRSRPVGITILAILLFISGVLTVLGSLLSFGATASNSGLLTLVIINLILGIAELVLGWGLWTLRPWAFWATVILEVINLLLGIFALIQGNASPTVWVSIILAAIILIYLFADRNVRAAFRT